MIFLGYIFLFLKLLDVSLMSAANYLNFLSCSFPSRLDPVRPAVFPFALSLVSTWTGRPRRSCWTSWRRGGGAPTSASPCGRSALILTGTPSAAPPPSSTRRCWSRSTCATWPERSDQRGHPEFCCPPPRSQPQHLRRPPSDRSGDGPVGGRGEGGRPQHPGGNVPEPAAELHPADELRAHQGLQEALQRRLCQRGGPQHGQSRKHTILIQTEELAVISSLRHLTCINNDQVSIYHLKAE